MGIGGYSKSYQMKERLLIHTDPPAGGFVFLGLIAQQTLLNVHRDLSATITPTRVFSIDTFKRY